MLSGMTSETFRLRLSSAAVLGAIALGGVAAHGQRNQGGGGGTTPLLIDFTAVTADGKPVTELTPADVQIKIGGKARTVTGLELKKFAGGAPAAPTAAATPAAPAAEVVTPPFATNEASTAPAPAAAGSDGGRSYLFIVDNESLSSAAEAPVKAAIEALLAGLTDRDRVAFSTAPNDTAQVGFGTGLARVRSAVAAMKMLKLAGEKTGNELLSSKSQSDLSSAEKNILAANLCRTSQTLALTNGLIQRLAGSPTPTNVIIIGGSLSTPAKETGNAGTCEVVQAAYTTLGDTAAEVRANFYVVQGDPGVMGLDPGLNQLAGTTGAGTLMRVNGDGFAPKILADSSTYWVATVAPDAGDKPGQAQRLEVKAKEGVTVRTRSMAAAPRPGMAAPGGGAAPAKPGAASPKDMVASQAQFTDLQLRASAIVQRGTGDQMNVLIQAEPVDPSVKITAMKVGFFDANNKGGSTDPKQIATYPITVPMSLANGQYRVRVAAQDSTGKSGAVDLNFSTALATAGPLKLSNLMIGAPQGDNGLKPQMVFTNEPEIRVFFEMYGQLTAGISAKFELATSDAGPAKETFMVAGGGATNEPDKFQVFGKIPIDKLPPGDYVVRAVVQMEGQPEGKSIRTFRKVAK